VEEEAMNVIEPLSGLPAGANACVVHLVPNDVARLVRLASFGLVPGASVHVQQKSPALVLRIVHTTLAIDRALGEEIYVRRTA
jgi:Fe2+ transport system protein FeoA